MRPARHPTMNRNDLQTIQNALRQAERLLAHETDPQKRADLRVQIQHLRFKLERARDGIYDPSK